MKYIGNGEGCTVLVLTDAESRLIRIALSPPDGHPAYKDALDAFNRGIQRGTERMSAEFKQRTK